MGWWKKIFSRSKPVTIIPKQKEKISLETAVKMEDDFLTPLACKNSDCETMKTALQKMTDFFVESDRLKVSEKSQSQNQEK